MRQQPTIIYIKNGIERTIKLNILNYQRIKKEIFKEYSSQQYIYIKEDIDLIQFKDVTFTVDTIECENNNTICILENCTFDKKNLQNYLCFKNGTFQVINPNLIGIIQLKALLVDNFDLNLSSIDLNKDLELSIEIYANDTITLAGDLHLSDLILDANKVTIGTDNTKTKITLLDYGWVDTMIEATKEIELKKCLIKNKGENKYLIFNSEKIKIDDESIIKTKSSTLINNLSYDKIDNSYQIINKKELKFALLISVLKTYRDLLSIKIESITDKYSQKKLLDENKEIMRKKMQIEDLRIQLAQAELELKEKETIVEEQYAQKRIQIIKSLSQKSTTYFKNK